MNQLIGTWRNKKNNHLYNVTGTRLNSTNAQNGQIMVEYQDVDNNKYYREINEFKEKFEKTDYSYVL